MNDSKENPPFRLANFNDVFPIARLIKEFYAKRQSVYKIPYDHESTVITADETVRHGICLIGPSSCAGAFLGVFPSNCNYVIASVKFWCFRNKREMVIFDALREECFKRGATHIDASSHFPENSMGKFYERRGMYPAETLYLGTLENCCKPPAKAVKPKL